MLLFWNIWASKLKKNPSKLICTPNIHKCQYVFFLEHWIRTHYFKWFFSENSGSEVNHKWSNIRYTNRVIWFQYVYINEIVTILMKIIRVQNSGYSVHNFYASEKIHDGNYINESNTKAFRNKTNLFKLWRKHFPSERTNCEWNPYLMLHFFSWNFF